MDELQVWKKLYLSRQFELRLAKSYKAKQLPPRPIYLSIGQEHVPAVVTTVLDDPYLFPQHRCHSWFLASGGTPDALLKELAGHPSGCSGGMGGSASVHNMAAKLYGHSGLLGDQVPIAAGMALGTNHLTVVVQGDAACEEDYVLATLGFAVTKNLPILFIVEDNGLSILTKTEVRRSWNIVDVAKGFGMKAYESSGVFHLSELLKSISLPALINVKVERHYWHAGAGQDNEPTHDDYEIFGAYIRNKYRKANEVETEVDQLLDKTWADNGYSS